MTPTRPRPGSMWATGEKTIDERISQGPSSSISVPGVNLETILEKAQAEGKKVGDVSTAEITDATPGGARLAHLPARLPGPGQHGLLFAGDEGRRRSRLDLGAGGRPPSRRAPRRWPQSLHRDDHQRSRCRQNGRRIGPGQGLPYVTDATGLAAVTDRKKPVLGLFNNGNMSLEWSGPAAATGQGNAAGALQREPAPGQRAEPGGHDQQGDGPAERQRKGFFLQVEGASIDKQDHATNACGQIGETIAFDEAIGIALDYQADPSEHPGRGHRRPLPHQPDRQRGRLRLGSADRLLDQPADQGRSDPGADLRHRRIRRRGRGSGRRSPPSQQHTGAVVPVWAVGPGALDVLGTNDHTDLFATLSGE